MFNIIGHYRRLIKRRKLYLLFMSSKNQCWKMCVSELTQSSSPVYVCIWGIEVAGWLLHLRPKLLDESWILYGTNRCDLFPNTEITAWNVPESPWSCGDGASHSCSWFHQPLYSCLGKVKVLWPFILTEVSHAGDEQISKLATSYYFCLPLIHMKQFQTWKG